jgi:hypothetical protein
MPHLADSGCLVTALTQHSWQQKKKKKKIHHYRQKKTVSRVESHGTRNIEGAHCHDFC